MSTISDATGKERSAEKEGRTTINKAIKDVVKDKTDYSDTGGCSAKLSNDLEAFYESHNVMVAATPSSSNPFRFVRLNPRYDSHETLRMLEKELNKTNSSNVDWGESGKEQNANHSIPVVRPIPVPWLEDVWGFYALPGHFSLASSPCFRSGRIYGMDVSSGTGAAALLTDFHDKERPCNQSPICGDTLLKQVRILDLCCCPGLKLLQMTDYYSEIKKHPVKVVGVDISKSRMDKCKTIVHKYLVDRETCGPNRLSPALVNVQLYLEDGTTFGYSDTLSGSSGQKLVFDSTAALEEESERGKRKRMNKSARARERKRLRQLASTEWLRTRSLGTADEACQNKTDDDHQQASSIRLFEFVLVDAECSTDGSFKHLRERMKEGPNKEQDNVVHEEKNPRLMDRGQLADLVALQKRLIASGFRLLKRGGAMVYSTCSLSTNQNEEVVQWLLQNRDDAFLIAIHFPLADCTLVSEGSIPGTVRFSPNLGQESSEGALLGDGFYLAKIGKR